MKLKKKFTVCFDRRIWEPSKPPKKRFVYEITIFCCSKEIFVCLKFYFSLPMFLLLQWSSCGCLSCDTITHLSLTVVRIKLRCDFLVAYDFAISTLWRNNIKLRTYSQTLLHTRTVVYTYTQTKTTTFSRLFPFAISILIFYI